MPLLFCLAVHDALAKVKEQLQDGEVIFTFLDDVYALCAPVHARDIYDLLAEKLFQVAGIRLQTGMTRTWNMAGEVPNRMVELGPSVWSPAGVKIFGSPVGTDLDAARERLEEETKFWQATPSVPDLQCAWQLLVQCAGPLCHHFMRNVPPEHSVAYAQGADRKSPPEARSRTAGHVANADWRTRFAFRMPRGASGFLVFVG